MGTGGSVIAARPMTGIETGLKAVNAALRKRRHFRSIGKGRMVMTQTDHGRDRELRAVMEGPVMCPAILASMMDAGCGTWELTGALR